MLLFILFKSYLHVYKNSISISFIPPLNGWLFFLNYIFLKLFQGKYFFIEYHKLFILISDFVHLNKCIEQKFCESYMLRLSWLCIFGFLRKDIVIWNAINHLSTISMSTKSKHQKSASLTIYKMCVGSYYK